MKGQVTEVFKIYDSRDKELVIPVYQRNYDWQEKQCKQLLVDLKSLVAEARPKHFFGAVVGKPEGSWKWVVIDGQQRLTTVSILMLALAHAVKDGHVEADDPELDKRIIRNYLVTDAGSDTPKFRLKPVKDDAEAYRRLFGPASEFIESSNVTANYRYFASQLPEMGLTADQIWNALCSLEVMHLDLEEHDDPQRIFESLNSTGLELSESDKVRNLVLMGLPEKEQNRVYEDFWNRIEKNVGYKTDAFLRWYLVTKTSVTPRLDQVYEAFKAFAIKEQARGAELLEEIRTYSAIYKEIERAATGVPVVDRRLKRLNILKQDVVLPLLMPLLADHRAGTVSDEDLAASLEIIEAYLFRRFVCGYGTNALNKIFATAYKEVKRLQTLGVSFAEVLAYSLTKRSGSGTFPNDDMFAEAFQTRDFYSLRSERRQYLFECLENENSNEVRDVATGLENGDLSIEHVMPQTLTPEWRQELGEDAEHVHEVYLHRIGNLTVTGYNSVYSNLPFAEKKTIERGFNESPYRLNRSIARQDQWTRAELEQRGHALQKIALAYWRYPDAKFVPAKVEHPVEALGDSTSFTNRDVMAFEFETASGQVRSWRELLVSVLRECVRIDRDGVFDHARENPYAYRVDGVFEGKGESFLDVVPGLEVAASTSTETKTNWLRRLFKVLGIDTEALLLTLREPGVDDTVLTAIAPASEYAALGRFSEMFDECAATGELATMAIESFVQEFGQWRYERPFDVLGKPVAIFLQDDDQLAGASAEQLRALISARISESEMFDPKALENAVRDGSLGDWVRRLAVAPSAT